VASLRKVPAANLTKFFSSAGVSFAYPTIDGVSVLDNSLRVLASGKFVKKLSGVLIGTNTNEGSVFAFALNRTTAASLRDSLNSSALSLPQLKNEVWKAEWENVEADLYIGNGTGNASAEFQAASNYITDSGFVVPVRKLAQAYVAAGIPVYKYRFDVISNATLQTYKQVYAAGYYMGVTHGSEIPFVYFARTGDPSNSLIGTWPKYSVPTRPNMYFGPNGTVGVKSEASLGDFRQEGQAFLESYLETSGNVPRPVITLDGR
ncbi:hypothetical protein HDU93_004389, partial [Gonapodya sp. JEL0774]